ncbi:hypothetical protein BVG81_006755 [Haliangium sp. UPWRP_2]|nr:hypothetical protein BVG81_006755 [Haliangium sp. UPWRP_2]
MPRPRSRSSPQRGLELRNCIAERAVAERLLIATQSRLIVRRGPMRSCRLSRLFVLGCAAV